MLPIHVSAHQIPEGRADDDVRGEMIPARHASDTHSCRSGVKCKVKPRVTRGLVHNNMRKSPHNGGVFGWKGTVRFV